MTALSDFQMSDISRVVQDQRSEPYYKQYYHCLMCWMPEGNMLRKLTHPSIDNNIYWRNNFLQSWGKNSGRAIISDQHKKWLHEVCDLLTAVKTPYKKIVCNNTLWIYTNDPNDFAAVLAHPATKLVEHKQADVCLPSDCVLLKQPKHKYRTYFRERWLEDNELAAVRRYFKARADQFRFGPGFAQLLKGHRMWMAAHYFVDHDDEKDTMFMNLACPRLVKKTLPIRARG